MVLLMKPDAYKMTSNTKLSECYMQKFYFWPVYHVINTLIILNKNQSANKWTNGLYVNWPKNNVLYKRRLCYSERVYMDKITMKICTLHIFLLATSYYSRLRSRRIKNIETPIPLIEYKSNLIQHVQKTCSLTKYN